MNRNLTYEMTDDLVLRSIRARIGLRNYISLNLVLAFIAAIPILILLKRGTMVVEVFLGIWGFLTLLYWMVFRNSKKASLANLAKLPNRGMSLTLTDASAQFTAPIGQFEFTWNMLEKVF